MKQFILLLFTLCLVLTLQAQVSKSVETTPGNLINDLSANELTTISDLTITGTMDARDFKTIRDSMPMLEVLDIKDVAIRAYEGYEGTYFLDIIDNLYYIYQEDEIPLMSFLERSSLRSVIFPVSLQSIGSYAFSGCTGLTGELDLPSTINHIDDGAFAYCTGLTGDLTIPPLVTVVETHTFLDCSGLTSLTIPPTVLEIEYGSFKGCSGLQYINAHPLSPVPLLEASGAFDHIDKTTCELRVPYMTRDLYAAAPVWREFVNITEHDQGFLLSATGLRFDKDGGTDNNILLKANIEWSAISDQPWLSVSPSSGNTDQIITLTVESNPTIAGRQGTITISSEGYYPQQVHVTQSGIPNIISISPGGLSKALTSAEKSALSHLILTGSMDARDFKTIHDQMPLLETLDISGVTIEAYTDTTYGNHITYSANAIPSAIWEWTDEFQTDYSLSEHQKLKEVKLPASLTTIGYRAFYFCRGITTVTMQSSVTDIGNEAFLACVSLTSINLPTSINHIGEKAFSQCISLSSIELPSSLTIIHPSTFADCRSLVSIDIPETVTAIGASAFSGCIELPSIVIPPLVTSIEYALFSNCSSLSTVVMPPVIATIKHEAFQNCSNLTSITIPKTVSLIGYAAFFGCINLQSIYAYPDHPVDLDDSDSWGVFEKIDKSRCTLYVPYASRELYASSYGWKDFLNIVEMAEFTLSPASLTLEAAQQSVAVELTTETEWTVKSDQPWLTITPASGSGNSTFTLHAETNPTFDQRTARVIFNTNVDTSPLMLVTQKGNPVTVELTAGNLAAEFPDTEMRKVNTLTLTGTMDARDFKFIRDHLPLVTELDLSGATIVAYSGDEGTYYSGYYQQEFYDYPANELPPSAFEGHATNLRIIFPPTLTSVGAKAFYGCTKLSALTIPPSVTFIGESAFAGSNISVINLPSSLTSIEDYLFYGCPRLTTVSIPATVTSIGKYAFAASQRLTFLEIPSSVTSMGEAAFEACYDLNTVILPASIDSIKDETFNSSGLTTITIPASVRYMGTGAFRACYLLSDLYTYAVEPPALAPSEVFAYFDKTLCTLYVPYGSKEKYTAADQWKDFTNIIEMAEFSLSDTTLTLEAKENSWASVQLVCSVSWNASCSQEWLTVSPGSGHGGQLLTFTAKNNPWDSARTAVVNVWANGIDTMTITVTQKGITVGLKDEMAENTMVKYFPNPFSAVMTIDIANPSHKEVNVDIFSISGQKIRSLARAQKEDQISLQWNGNNDAGQKVPNGLYLLKVNKQTMKVMVKR